MATTATSDNALPMRGQDVSKEILQDETTRLATILGRVGKRLKNYVGKLGSHALPDESAVENMKWYSATCLGLLKEQRERKKLAGASGLPEMSEAEHAEALEAFRRETVLQMTDGELEKLAAERAALKAGT